MCDVSNHLLYELQSCVCLRVRGNNAVIPADQFLDDCIEAYMPLEATQDSKPSQHLVLR